jgi:glucose/arabinose dehydrogenase
VDAGRLSRQPDRLSRIAVPGLALISGLSSKAIVRVELDGDTAREVERYPMDARIRCVVEGPGGALWVLEDERGGSGGRLLKLTPKK